MNKIQINSVAKNSYQMSEAIKSLRTNVQFCGTDIHCISLTSCVPNEGKSLISVELAYSFAEIGKKVIMIDTDMRKSVFTSRHTVKQGVPGLSQYLTNQASFEEVVSNTDKEGLDIILTGVFPPNPVELLASNRFAELIKKCREIYDYIIIDTAPLGAVIDSAIVSTLCDGALLVIALDKVSIRTAQEVKEQLEKANVKILGTVLNYAETQTRHYRYNYYKNKHGYKKYYSSEEPKTEKQ